MLYEWLAQADDRRFDLAFKRYYAETSTQLIRYLARRSSLADLDCEQIAVDALLKFFSRVGRERRQASASVGLALSQIVPLNLGAFHVQQVQRWTREIGSFRHASMNFTAEDGTGNVKSQIQALTDSIAPLQHQGYHLLETARALVTGNAPAGPRSGCESCAIEEASADEEAITDEEAISLEYELLRKFALSLRDAAHSSADSIDVESRHPGLVRFVDGAWTVVEVLPLLRVPTSGYLFDIAHSLYLDECKARGRRKRGGSGYATGGVEASGAAGTPAMATGFSLDDRDWPDDADGNRSAVSFAAAITDFGVDPTGEHIDEDFCERFYAYLRKPLQDAEEAHQQAAARGRAAAERKRLESVARKSERLMAVLAMRIEGRTQQEIAATLELSRNQVKYIVEHVQSAYEQFCTATARTGRS